MVLFSKSEPFFGTLTLMKGKDPESVNKISDVTDALESWQKETKKFQQRIGRAFNTFVISIAESI
jgi:hypothetical protein